MLFMYTYNPGDTTYVMVCTYIHTLDSEVNSEWLQDVKKIRKSNIHMSIQFSVVLRVSSDTCITDKVCC